MGGRVAHNKVAKRRGERKAEMKGGGGRGRGRQEAPYICKEEFAKCAKVSYFAFSYCSSPIPPMRTGGLGVVFRVDKRGVSLPSFLYPASFPWTAGKPTGTGEGVERKAFHRLFLRTQKQTGVEKEREGERTPETRPPFPCGITKCMRPRDNHTPKRNFTRFPATTPAACEFTPRRSSVHPSRSTWRKNDRRDGSSSWPYTR